MFPLRYTAVALLVVLFCAPLVSAQDWARTLFPTKEHDFGTVPRNAKAEYRFEFTNPFEEDIHLSDVTSSCVCSTPKIETPDLKAHETGAVMVHFNTDKVSGAQKATITVHIDKPSPAVVTLQVRGYVRNDVTFDPASVQFGSVLLGEEREKSVKVVYHGSNAFWKIQRAESANPNISVEIGQTTPKRKLIEVELKLKLNKTAPTGRLDENIFLVSSDSTAGRIPLMVEGEVRAAISVKPDVFSLGTVKEGQIIDRTLVFVGDQPFVVKGYAVSGDSIRVEKRGEFETEPKTMHVVRLNFVVSKAEEYKSIRETVRFETDNPDVSPTLTFLAVVKPDGQSASEN